MLRRAFLLTMLACVLFLAGCETVKGAGEGAKQDFKNAQKVDGWLQDNLW
ncbi:MAG: hypothetical protein WC559_04355 [Candidatus Omnitrophota bacterium]